MNNQLDIRLIDKSSFAPNTRTQPPATDWAGKAERILKATFMLGSSLAFAVTVLFAALTVHNVYDGLLSPDEVTSAQAAMRSAVLTPVNS